MNQPLPEERSLESHAAALLEGSPYRSYLYGYPHKTAYRPLDPPVPLREIWQGEDRSALFLYLHVPFCEMRCGFCNLFTTVNPAEDLVEAWLAALSRQVRVVREALGDARFARVVLGGGTPTFLEAGQLERAFDLLEAMGAQPRRVPVGCEVSPATVTPERLAVLEDRGVDRVSIGVQSFLPSEAKAAGRPQDLATVERALDRLRRGRFSVLNLDLIYGIDGQTEESFVQSLQKAMAWAPEELYLYPLYVRPLTGLGKRAGARDRAWDEQRLALYRAGRAFLLSEGYSQASMRMFRRGRELHGPPYRCQEDGMVGLGVGARSYASALHWSTEYAVAQSGVRSIVRAYAERTEREHGHADWGFRLDGDEQRRRYVALSLLSEGLDQAQYRARFGTDALADLPQLSALGALGLAGPQGERLVLSEAGLERSDAIGPWLFSDQVAARMAAWEAR